MDDDSDRQIMKDYHEIRRLLDGTDLALYGFDSPTRFSVIGESENPWGGVDVREPLVSLLRRFQETRAALEGMLESYDVLYDIVRATGNEVALGVVTGAFVGTVAAGRRP